MIPQSLLKLKKFLSVIILTAFVSTSIIPPSIAQVVMPGMGMNLPVPGTVVNVTPAFNPILMKGVMIHPEDSLKFDFIIDKGSNPLAPDAFNKEANKLIKYFLASLTIPENQMWVNLSPYEKDRIIPNEFGQTEMGRDLLAQDYMLKQLTASLLMPEGELGRKFWERVHAQAKEKFGTTEVPMDTFNKIWIIPENAKVYENEKGAFVVGTHLKVMLEEDYLALDMNKNSTEHGLGDVKKEDLKPLTKLQTEVLREVIIPEIEKEVNEGETFANLRQIYYSMVLASWYKQALKESLLGKIYVDKAKTQGVNVEDPKDIDKIYSQYVEAFKKGMAGTIKDEYDASAQEVISRKYVTGGVRFGQQQIDRQSGEDANAAMAAESDNTVQVVARINEVGASDQNASAAMLANLRFMQEQFRVILGAIDNEDEGIKIALNRLSQTHADPQHPYVGGLKDVHNLLDRFPPGFYRFPGESSVPLLDFLFVLENLTYLIEDGTMQRVTADSTRGSLRKMYIQESEQQGSTAASKIYGTIKEVTDRLWNSHFTSAELTSAAAALHRRLEYTQERNEVLNNPEGFSRAKDSVKFIVDHPSSVTVSILSKALIEVREVMNSSMATHAREDVEVFYKRLLSVPIPTDAAMLVEDQKLAVYADVLQTLKTSIFHPDINITIKEVPVNLTKGDKEKLIAQYLPIAEELSETMYIDSLPGHPKAYETVVTENRIGLKFVPSIVNQFNRSNDSLESYTQMALRMMQEAIQGLLTEQQSLRRSSRDVELQPQNGVWEKNTHKRIDAAMLGYDLRNLKKILDSDDKEILKQMSGRGRKPEHVKIYLDVRRRVQDILKYQGKSKISLADSSYIHERIMDILSGRRDKFRSRASFTRFTMTIAKRIEKEFPSLHAVELFKQITKIALNGGVVKILEDNAIQLRTLKPGEILKIDIRSIPVGVQFLIESQNTSSINLFKNEKGEILGEYSVELPQTGQEFYLTARETTAILVRAKVKVIKTGDELFIQNTGPSSPVYVRYQTQNDAAMLGVTWSTLPAKIAEIKRLSPQAEIDLADSLTRFISNRNYGNEYLDNSRGSYYFSARKFVDLIIRLAGNNSEAFNNRESLRSALGKNWKNILSGVTPDFKTVYEVTNKLTSWRILLGISMRVNGALRQARRKARSSADSAMLVEKDIKPGETVSINALLIPQFTYLYAGTGAGRPILTVDASGKLIDLLNQTGGLPNLSLREGKVYPMTIRQNGAGPFIDTPISMIIQNGTLTIKNESDHPAIIQYAQRNSAFEMMNKIKRNYPDAQMSFDETRQEWTLAYRGLNGSLEIKTGEWGWSILRDSLSKETFYSWQALTGRLTLKFENGQTYDIQPKYKNGPNAGQPIKNDPLISTIDQPGRPHVLAMLVLSIEAVEKALPPELAKQLIAANADDAQGDELGLFLMSVKNMPVTTDAAMLTRREFIIKSAIVLASAGVAAVGSNEYRNRNILSQAEFSDVYFALFHLRNDFDRSLKEFKKTRKDFLALKKRMTKLVGKNPRMDPGEEANASLNRYFRMKGQLKVIERWFANVNAQNYQDYVDNVRRWQWPFSLKAEFRKYLIEQIERRQRYDMAMLSKRDAKAIALALGVGATLNAANPDGAVRHTIESAILSPEDSFDAGRISFRERYAQRLSDINDDTNLSAAALHYENLLPELDFQIFAFKLDNNPSNEPLVDYLTVIRDIVAFRIKHPYANRIPSGNIMPSYRKHMGEFRRINRMLKAVQRKIDHGTPRDITHAERILKMIEKSVPEIVNKFENEPVYKSPITFSEREQVSFLYNLRVRAKGIIEKVKKFKGILASKYQQQKGIEENGEFTKGGIDLNPTTMNMQIERDGKGVPLPVNLQHLDNLNIQGFQPVIINVVPITNLPLLLGLNTKSTEDSAKEINSDGLSVADRLARNPS